MAAKVNVKNVKAEDERPLEPKPEDVEQETIEPAVDIYDDDNDRVIVADLPGVKREDVSAAVDAGVLTIGGKIERRASDERALYVEYEPADFRWTFTLGESIDAEGISASVKNGVLTVRLRKAESAKTRRIVVAGE